MLKKVSKNKKKNLRLIHFPKQTNKIANELLFQGEIHFT